MRRVPIWLKKEKTESVLALFLENNKGNNQESGLEKSRLEYYVGNNQE